MMGNGKRIVVALGVMLVALSLSACKDRASPKGVSKIAWRALKNNKIDEFKPLLMGVAQLEYGNPKGFEKLRTSVATLDVRIGKTKPLSRVKVDAQNFLTTSEVSVMGRWPESDPGIYEAAAKVGVVCRHGAGPWVDHQSDIEGFSVSLEDASALATDPAPDPKPQSGVPVSCRINELVIEPSILRR